MGRKPVLEQVLHVPECGGDASEKLGLAPVESQEPVGPKPLHDAQDDEAAEVLEEQRAVHGGVPCEGVQVVVE